MYAGHNHFVGLRIGAHDTEVRDQKCGALGANAEGLAFAAGPSVAERGEEVELTDETAPSLLHHDKDLAAAGGDLRGSSTAGQPDLGLPVIADDRAIEIAKAVHLGSTEETDGDTSALK